MTSFPMLRYCVVNLFHCLTIINIIINIAFLFYNMNKKIYSITYRLRKKNQGKRRGGKTKMEASYELTLSLVKKKHIAFLKKGKLKKPISGVSEIA